jgi:acyl-CoA synthetase (AMP-forming)/AMP-acid ligase II
MGERTPMLGLMQCHPLMISALLRHAARHHGDTEIVSRFDEGRTHRTTWAGLEQRARRLVRAPQALGIKPPDRVGTLAWNDFRHLETYYAVSGMGAIIHTINPRLDPDDVVHVMTQAGDRLLLADVACAPLIAEIAPRLAGTCQAVVLLVERGDIPDLRLPTGMDLLWYEDMLAAADDDYEWPIFDENSASALCYTSGTTGRPRGVLYSHRSTVLEAYAMNSSDAFALRAVDRVLPVVPMFHVNAWNLPYAAALAGSAIILPSRRLDGASLTRLMNDERVTMSAGVPTVWAGLLQHLRTSGERLTTLRRLIVGGSACSPLLIQAFGREYGVEVQHAWGMSEVSPVGMLNAPKSQQLAQSLEERERFALKQGRVLSGLDMKIVGENGAELPWDGVQAGELKVRGAWVASAYFGNEPDSALDANGWFATGDIATIDRDGFVLITDRAKDLIKSGGEWISSIELENIAMSHPDVAEAAAVAVPHPKWDERPLLLVVPKAGTRVTAESVLRAYEGRVPK